MVLNKEKNEVLVVQDKHMVQLSYDNFCTVTVVQVIPVNTHNRTFFI